MAHSSRSSSKLLNEENSPTPRPVKTKAQSKVAGLIENLKLTHSPSKKTQKESESATKRKRSESNRNVFPDRADNLHLSQTTLCPEHAPQTFTPALKALSETHSLYTQEDSMDVFQDNAHLDSASYHTLAVDTQIKHLTELLVDAKKIVAGLQHRDSLEDARTPSILDLLNNVVSPITQLPFQTVLAHQLKLQEDIAALKISMDSLSLLNTHIQKDMTHALRGIQDTNTRVSNLERPTPIPTPYIPTTPTLSIPTTRPTTQPNQPAGAKAPANLPALPPPSNSHHPSRLVIQFPPDGLREQDRKDPQTIVRSVNIALEKNPRSRHLRVVAAKFSVQGNLVLSTRADQTASELIKASEVIAPIINPNNLPIVFREDKKWFKIQVDGVSTTTYAYDGTGITHSSDSIHKELAMCNPSYTTALPHIVAPPRWMRTYEELRMIPRSSIVFAVDDETLAKNILLNRSLAIFGRHCSLRAYQDRPPVVQCKHCWGWNHKADLCKKTQTCRLCSLDHSETNHIEPACVTCKDMDANGDTSMKEGPSCLHNLKCANCISAGLEDVSHTADARRCPSRLEKYGTARSNERRPDTTNPWKTVTSKPRKKTRPPPISATTTTTTPLVTSDHFVNFGAGAFGPETLPYTEPEPPLPPHPSSSTSDWTLQTLTDPPI